MFAALIIVAALVVGSNAGLLPGISLEPAYNCEAGKNVYDMSSAQFCKRVCQECVCKGTTLTSTCEDSCVAAWFQVSQTCSTGISFSYLDTFPIDWTEDSGCARNALANDADWNPDNTCEYVCGCCTPSPPMSNDQCLNQCKNGALFPWLYDNVCHTLNAPGFQIPGLIA